MWDYDEVGTHILIDGQVGGQPRKLITHSGAQRLPLHDGPRQRADRAGASPIWTGQLDQGHRPEDRQAGRLRSQQGHPDLCGRAEPDPGETAPRRCARRRPAATISGRRPTARKTKLLYIPALSNCVTVTHRHQPSTTRQAAGTAAAFKTTERYESDIDRRRSADRRDQEEACTCAIRTISGALATGGGLVFTALLDGTVAAYRRHHPRPAVEDQCRLGLHRAADDLRGRRQAICRDRVGAEPRSRRAGSSITPELQGAAQRDHAVRVRAVRLFCSLPEDGEGSAAVQFALPRETKTRGRRPMRTRHDHLRTPVARRRHAWRHRPALAADVTPRAARSMRQGAAELADEPPHL